MGFFKADELLETPEFMALPRRTQEHIRKPTTPLWEMSSWNPPFSPSADPKLSYLTVITFLHCPQSRGTIKLSSTDPKDAPLIDLHFLAHPFDRQCAMRPLDECLSLSRKLASIATSRTVFAFRLVAQMKIFWHSGRLTVNPHGILAAQ